MSYYLKHVFVCTNQKAPGKTCCANSGGESSFEYLKDQLKAMGLFGEGKIRVSKSGCLGRCSLGPCVVIYPDNIWYNCRTRADVDDIINEYLVLGHVVERLLINS